MLIDSNGPVLVGEGSGAVPHGEGEEDKDGLMLPPVPYRNLAPSCQQFSEETGPTFQMPPDAQPIDFFRHLLDDCVAANSG